MAIGPVELLVLSFPSERADPAVVSSVQEVVASGFVTVLDLVFVSKSLDGEVRVVDVSEGLDEHGLAVLEVQGQALISDDDLELATDTLDPGTSAVVIVWADSADRGLRATRPWRFPRRLPRRRGGCAHAG